MTDEQDMSESLEERARKLKNNLTVTGVLYFFLSAGMWAAAEYLCSVGKESPVVMVFLVVGILGTFGSIILNPLAYKFWCSINGYRPGQLPITDDLELRARKMRWGLGAQSVACILAALMSGVFAWLLAQEASPMAPVLLVGQCVFLLLTLGPPFLYRFWCHQNGYPRT